MHFFLRGCWWCALDYLLLCCSVGAYGVGCCGSRSGNQAGFSFGGSRAGTRESKDRRWVHPANKIDGRLVELVSGGSGRLAGTTTTNVPSATAQTEVPNRVYVWG
jgi:hypothetical protein